MMYYINQLKNWKSLDSYWRRMLKADLMRNALWMLLGIVLYLLLNNTGLLIYIILILKAKGSK